MRNNRIRDRFTILALILMLPIVVSASASAADRTEPLPEELEGVGVVEHLGSRLPLDRLFLDHQGRRVSLGESFGHGRPVLLTFNYSSCPMLCHVQRDGLIEALKAMTELPGRDFDIVTIGIDPRETHERAGATWKATIKAYGRPEAALGWKFLTGREADIRTVADAAGFGYRYVSSRDEYAHAATVIVCSPEGVVARYVHGVRFEPDALRLALSEAGQGKTASATTSALDQLLMYCFHYDPSTKRYAPAAMNVMRLGAGLAMVALLAYLIRSWTRDRAGVPPRTLSKII